MGLKSFMIRAIKFARSQLYLFSIDIKLFFLAIESRKTIKTDIKNKKVRVNERLISILEYL